MMTTQEVFTKVATHLLTQGTRAKHADGRCVYRADNGRACAVGCLIDDDHYERNLEGESLSCSRIRNTLSLCGVDAYDPDTLELLGQLMACHDARSPHEWQEQLQSIASQFKLEMPKELDQ